MEFQNIRNYHEATWLQFSKPDAEGVCLTKQESPEYVSSRFPRLKAISIEFYPKEYRSDFDAAAYLDEWFKYFELEYFELGARHSMTKFPDTFKSQKFKYLQINLGEISSTEDGISELSTLVELNILATNLKLDDKFGELQNLKKLKITADSIEGIDQLSSLINLEYLSLTIKDLDHLPADLNHLKNLKTFKICSKEGSFTIPEDLKFEYLEHLDLSLSNQTKKIPAALLETKQLQSITLEQNVLNSCAIDLPSQLSLPNVETISLRALNIVNFPIITCPKLESLQLVRLPVQTFLSNLRAVENLNSLVIHGMDLIDDISNLSSVNIVKYSGPIFAKSECMDLNVWPYLENLTIHGDNDSNKLHSLNIDQNLALETLTFQEVYFSSFLKLPESIKDVKVWECRGLKSVNLDYHLPSLQSILFTKCPDFEEFLLEDTMLPQLKVIGTENCPNFNFLSVNALALPSFNYVRNRVTALNADTSVTDLDKLLQFIQSNPMPPEDRRCIGYWLFRYQNQLPFTDVIRESTIRLLSYGFDPLFQLLSKNFEYINKNKVLIEDFKEIEFKNKKIGLVGSTFGSKTKIKEDCKKLGLVLTTKFQEMDFVLASKKALIGDDLNENAFFINELEFNSIVEKFHPQFLKQDTVTDTHIQSLKQILWSVNPESENLALEMMKKGGMPDEVLGECIIIAKTSSDAGVKSKYKAFLKGKVPEEAFKLISKNVRFDLQNSYRSLFGEFSDELLAKIFIPLYKRTGEHWGNVLDYSFEEDAIRKEIIQNHIVPDVLFAPHYVRLHYSLKSNELKSVLELSDLKGTLKRLHLKIHQSVIPQVLGEFITLKELVIHGDLKGERLPDEIYKLKRLNKLNVSSTTLLEIDDRVENLVEIKEICLFTKNDVQFSDKIKGLKKLTRTYVSRR